MEVKKNVFEARSKEDGIVFRSNKIPVLSYEASIDSSGKIKTQSLPTVICDIKEIGISISLDAEKIRKVEYYCKIAIGITAFLSIIISKQISIAFALIYFSIIALKDLIEFCQLSWSLKFGKYKSTARFHAAEHKVVNAYRKKQGIPGIEEIRKASRFDKMCGSRDHINKIVIFGLISILIAVAPGINVYKYIIFLTLVITLSILGRKYEIFRFLQIFVTNKPTDKELEVALAGIQFFDKMEEEISEEHYPMGMIIIKFEDKDEEGESTE